MKKLTAFMLAVVFSLSLMCSQAKIKGFSGDGSKNNPYLIQSEKDLYLLSDMVYNGESFEGKYFLLMEDILMNDTKKFYSWEDMPPENEWRPIGTPTTYFRGFFDGNGKTVTGIYLSDTSKNYAGLFGYIKNAEIKNLSVEKSYISGRNDIGLICGIAENSVIENVRAEGIVVARDNGGGIAGSVDESSVSKVLSSVEVISGGHAGGIIGLSEKTDIVYASSKSDIKGILTSGGIAGHLVDGKIENAYSEGEITAESYSGGIAGYLPEESDIYYAYSVGNILSEKAAGGIAGLSYGSINSVYFKGFLAGEYKGGISGINSPLSEEMDFIDYGDVSNAYYAEDRCDNPFGYTVAEEDEQDVLGLKSSKLDSLFIKKYILNPFSSEDNLTENPGDCWVFKDKNPKLWFEGKPLLEEKPAEDEERPSDKPEIGIKTGEVVSTDIRAYIEGKELKAVNIGGKMAVALKDLREFGFEVLFDEEKREVSVTYKGGEIKPTYVYEDDGFDIGSYISDVLSTDIEAYLEGEKTESFNAEGYTHIYFRSLEAYGEVSFDEEKREARLVIDK